MAEPACLLSSPLGRLRAEMQDGAIVRLRFVDGAESPAGTARPPAIAAALQEQLDAYFRGELRRFSLPLRLLGRPFEQRVWQLLTEIPFGETLSYGALARAVGTPGGARAVGRANGANPVWLLVPCHRVIRSDGGIGGYGGGVERKRALLALERRAMSTAASAPTSSRPAAAT